MHSQLRNQIRQIDSAPFEKSPEAKKTGKLDTLLESIRDDARGLSGAYSKQTLVPEGGE